MKRVLALFPLLLILVFACSAEAITYSETDEPAWNSAVGAEQAAQVMGVSSTQAEEDLAVQHEAFHTIEKLMEAGDTVWFDNKTATVHVYSPSTAAATAARVAIPSSVANHIVREVTPPNLTASKKVSTAESCGKFGAYEDYCTPMKSGETLEHVQGSDPDENLCTAGFMVRSYSGTPYILTAAHCALWGTTFYSNSFESVYWPGGTFCYVGSSVRGISPWGGHDSAITSVSGPSSPECRGVLPEIHNFSTGGNTAQTGATNTPFVGEYVCHWGIASNHHCGTERAVNVPTVVAYEGGNWTIESTDQVCGYSHAGDSGGPVTDGTYTGDATGILIAGKEEPECSGGYEWVEERIFPILDLWDVYVVTDE